jgi:hypothetical protein
MKTDTAFTSKERALYKTLNEPGKIQEFLDSLSYSTETCYRSPRQVIRDRKAHCFDGALFAASALRQLGFAPLLMDLRAVRDDDHVLAVFKSKGRLGAIGKSNFVGLRFREPVYKGLRELAMSYFEQYYNAQGEKTLRAYSELLDLTPYDGLKWMTSSQNLSRIVRYLDETHHVPVISAAQARELHEVDARSLAAGLVGANKAGLYKCQK